MDTETTTVDRTGYVGWVEFVRDGGSTTHIAYLYEDGSIYFPEGPQVVSEMDLRGAEIRDRMWPLVRAEWRHFKASREIPPWPHDT